MKHEDTELVASNPNARNFQIIETLEAGISLLGSEVKSVRKNRPELRDAYVDLRPGKRGFQAWLVHFHIAPYLYANRENHEPLRARQLLIKRAQLSELFGQVIQKGMSLIVLRCYFRRGKLKVLLGLGRGKKLHDKRQDLLRKADLRDMRERR